MSKIVTDLRALPLGELEHKVSALKTELVDKQRALRMNELPNPHAVSSLRHQIAVAKTLINEARRASNSPVKNEELSV